MVSLPAPLPRDLVAEHARIVWERAGRPKGKDVEIWFRAEHELRLRLQHRDQTAALLARGGGERRSRC